LCVRPNLINHKVSKDGTPVKGYLGFLFLENYAKLKALGRYQLMSVESLASLVDFCLALKNPDILIDRWEEMVFEDRKKKKGLIGLVRDIERQNIGYILDQLIEKGQLSKDQKQRLDIIQTEATFGDTLF